MRRGLAFFVRCAEVVLSPCCGRSLVVIGSRQRKLVGAGGEPRLLVIRRLRCAGCRKVHHELPDCIVPYKRYESACIEEVVAEPESPPAIAADDATLRRWRQWFREQSAYLLCALRAIAHRFHLDSAEAPSVPSQSAHQRIGQLVGDAPGWLGRMVRPIVNVHLWVHTRSAFLSG